MLGDLELLMPTSSKKFNLASPSGVSFANQTKELIQYVREE